MLTCRWDGEGEVLPIRRIQHNAGVIGEGCESVFAKDKSTKRRQAATSVANGIPFLEKLNTIEDDPV